MWVKDKHSHFLFVNQQFFKSFGLSEKEIIGKTDLDITADKSLARKYLRDDVKTMETQENFSVEEKITGSDGSIEWAETIKVPVYNDNKQVIGTAGMARNITERKNAQQKLIHMAYHDELTGLPNRTYFKNRVNKLLATEGAIFAVILFDLNDFKIINDILGHSSGDQILIQISERLKLLMDENTVVARLSGDEFAIAHNYCKQKNTLASLLDSLLQKFDSPFAMKEANYTIGASFGITIAPQDGRNFDTLLKHADLAMHQSKANNHKHCVYFIKKFADELLYEMNLSNQIHDAILQEQFSLVYQPKIESTSRELIGVESLLRWEMSDGKAISPAIFIPIAEKNGFIIELGNWVIKSVLKQMRRWLDNNISVVPVSINVSAIQLLQPQFLSYLFQQLEHYQVPGHLLEIELTEGVLMDNVDDTLPLLQEMREREILVSIDDFGTGYSSLSYLPVLPVDRLKIDRAFICNLQSNLDNQKIVQTIVSLANNFNLLVIAEGVETEQELSATIDCGITEIQGYYFSRPLCVADLESYWLNAEK
jgi:polar amino acid transport system substrate-binding protein